MLRVVDGHCDVLMDVVTRRARGERTVLKRCHLPQWNVGSVGAGLLTVGGDLDAGSDPCAQALLTLDLLEQEVAESPEAFVLVRTARDWEAGARERRFAIVPHLEGGSPIGQDLGYLRTFHRLGVRSIGLTWNRRNAIGDGVGQREARGLTAFGGSVVREMDRLGMLIDLSHMHEKGFWDVLALCERPLVVSHANARALCDHVRNLTDRQLEAIAAKGGLVGVAFYPGFVDRENPTLERVADHVDHIRRLAGIAHVALGPDFIDFAQDAIMARLAGAGVSYEPGAAYPKGLESTRGIPLLLDELRRRGYREDDLSAICHGNFTRVLRQVLS